MKKKALLLNEGISESDSESDDDSPDPNSIQLDLEETEMLITEANTNTSIESIISQRQQTRAITNHSVEEILTLWDATEKSLYNFHQQREEFQLQAIDSDPSLTNSNHNNIEDTQDEINKLTEEVLSRGSYKGYHLRPSTASSSSPGLAPSLLLAHPRVLLANPKV